MTTRGPLRKLVADLCAHAPLALVAEALSLALAQAGDYQGPEPARMLARLIEDAFAGGAPPTSAQINSVSLAVDAWQPEEDDPFVRAFKDVVGQPAAMAMVAPDSPNRCSCRWLESLPPVRAPNPNCTATEHKYPEETT